jgi:hypothetical protein
MLEALKKWLGGTAPAPRSWRAIADWAEGRQAQFHADSKGEGFAVNGRTGPVPWRLEWGPSQRAYVSGHELRLRAELGLPGELQILRLSRTLAAMLEKKVFDEYVESVQTRIETNTPPEMRWLVMFPKVPGSELKSLRQRYAAVATHKSWLLRWLDGSLTEELLHAPGHSADPVVWMIGRGRLMLRTVLPEADADSLEPWLGLFESALRQARRVQAEVGAAGAALTQPSLWSTSAMPDEPSAPPVR